MVFDARLRRFKVHLKCSSFQIKIYKKAEEFWQFLYVRYVETFLIGVLGPRRMAKEVQIKVIDYLKNDLSLKVLKSNVSHFKSEYVSFQGFLLQIRYNANTLFVGKELKVIKNFYQRVLESSKYFVKQYGSVLKRAGYMRLFLLIHNNTGYNLFFKKLHVYNYGFKQGIEILLDFFKSAIEKLRVLKFQLAKINGSFTCLVFNPESLSYKGFLHKEKDELIKFQDEVKSRLKFLGNLSVAKLGEGVLKQFFGKDFKIFQGIRFLAEKFKILSKSVPKKILQWKGKQKG